MTNKYLEKIKSIDKADVDKLVNAADVFKKVEADQVVNAAKAFVEDKIDEVHPVPKVLRGKKVGLALAALGTIGAAAAAGYGYKKYMEKSAIVNPSLAAMPYPGDPYGSRLVDKAQQINKKTARMYGPTSVALSSDNLSTLAKSGRVGADIANAQLSVIRSLSSPQRVDLRGLETFKPNSLTLPHDYGRMPIDSTPRLSPLDVAKINIEKKFRERKLAEAAKELPLARAESSKPMPKFLTGKNAGLAALALGTIGAAGYGYNKYLAKHPAYQ